MQRERSRAPAGLTRWRWVAAACTVALTAFAPSTARAQEGGVVGGTVVNERSQPLPGVQVTVEGTELGALTDAGGRFRITRVTGTNVRLQARRIGYRPVDVPATVGQTDVRITMGERAIELSEIVVTGTAGDTERRAVGASVSQINAANVVATQPIQSFQQLLTGRATGVAVIGGSGQVGTGARIRVRGASSLSLSNEPLIYVDGVRVDNTQASGPVNQAFGSRSISRWNDFSPDDIESIEVIKGPAAATLYGTEAANGVIQIITKRGTSGAPAWNLTMRGGSNWFADPEGRLWENYGTNPTTGAVETIDIVELEQSRGNEIWRTGYLTDVDLNVSGGSPQLRYYAGIGTERNEGADPSNSLRRTNGRLNLTLAASERWDLAANLGYTSGRTYIPLESGGGGLTWTTYFAQPQSLDTPRRGFYSGPPEAYTAGFDLFQDIGRFTGSVSFNHRPTSWLSQRLVFGADILAEDNQEIAQRNDELAIFFSGLGNPQYGYMDISTRNVTYTTLDYGVSATLPVTETVQSTTSVGAQYYSRITRTRGMFGTGFPAAGFESLQTLNQVQSTGDDQIENTTVGMYLQQRFGWNDRVFVTAAVRADDNSSFGENFDLVYYPKADVSWVLSEEPFFNVPGVNTLRLRAAYGQSGQQPEAFSALQTYVFGGSFTVTPGAIGNPDLGPERSSELEVGADVSFFEDRLGLDMTYFRGTTKDAILTRSVAPSLGYSGSQFFNAGQVDRTGFEVMIRGTPLQRDNATLDLTLSVGTNSNEIKSLGETDFISTSAYSGHAVGYPVGSFWEKRIVSAEFDANNRATNIMCDDGQGGSVACGSAPRIFLGNTIPETEAALTAGLTLWNDLRLNAQLDYRGGYKKLDANYRVRCHLFRECRQNYYPQEFSPVEVAYAQFGGSYYAEVLDDASFTRLREVSATYTIPPRFLGNIGLQRAAVTLAGRNLALWTDYMGLEPEASFVGGTRGGYGQFEQNVLPQLQSLVVTFNVGF